MQSNNTICPVCQKQTVEVFLDLGKQPPANSLLAKDDIKNNEKFYPLQVGFCHSCTLVQVTEIVPPDTIFNQDYPYYSSFSPAQLEHAKNNVLDLIQSRRLGAESFAIEIGSNDGYLLKNYVENEIPCLGVDPSTGPSRVAQEAGIPVIPQFFNKTLAESLVAKGTRADVIHLNNTFAHIPAIHDLVEGMNLVLKDDGVIVIEVPYVRELIDHLEFDTIYHEHFFYFSVTALDYLFRKHGLFLNKIKQIPIHGGTLRLYIEKQEAIDESVSSLLNEEKTLGIDKIAYYRDFSEKVENLKKKLSTLLNDLKSKGHSIIAYGASAKGSTLINYTNIGTDILSYCVDRNTNKQGKLMPGMHIPIYDPKRMLSDMPDYTLLLTWNFADEILAQQEEYRKKGGRFIIPVPDVGIV